MAAQSREQFADDLIKLLAVALESGERGVPTRSHSSDSPFMHRRHSKEFIAACHRGFEKGQARVLSSLRDLSQTTEVSPDERDFRMLCLRKVIDAIAVQLLRMKDHVRRRLCLEPRIRNIDPRVVEEAHARALEMNRESRQTFALVADLTTFVQVCDIIRVDFRDGRFRTRLIELKTGKVNDMLLEELEKFEPRPEALAQLDEDPRIPASHLPQAKRMLRQRIRLARIEETLRTDHGTDPVTGATIHLSKDEIELESFCQAVERCCSAASHAGSSSMTVGHCLHIAVGSARDPEAARDRTFAALQARVADNRRSAPQGLRSVVEEVSNLIGDEPPFMVLDALDANLHAIPAFPFPLWGLSWQSLRSVVAGELTIAIAFDVPGFIWMCRNQGLSAGLSSRSEAARMDQALAGWSRPRWGNRGLVVGLGDWRLSVEMGMLARFLVDWANPVVFMRDIREDLISRGSRGYGDLPPRTGPS